MNATFWVISLLLVLVCIGIVLPSILRKPKFGAEDLRVQNILIAKEKLKELEVELKIEKITEDIYKIRKQELETALINDTEANDVVIGDCEHSTNAAWVVALSTPVLAVVLYLVLGTSPELLNNPNLVSNQAGQQQAQMTPQQMAKSLVARLEQEPNNADGWAMLGQTYMELKRYTEASTAFERSSVLAPNNPQVMFRHADALAMANNRSLEGKAIELIEAALKLAPNDTTGLWLSGIYAEEHNDFEKALMQWSLLYKKLKGGQYDQKIMEMLTRVNNKVAADKQIDLAALSNSSNESKAVAGGAAIEVTIAVDPALSSVVSANDTVFIYAKAMSGPPMPLAAIKKKVKDLPITVTLNDAMAMMPSMKISSFPTVKVGARISKSGNAITQPGDIKQEVGNISTSNGQAVSLLIGAAANTTKVTSKTTQTVTPRNPSTSSAVAIKLKVSLDPSFASQVSDSDTVFIFAKAMSGPPMPLAVVKRSVKDLPIYIELDDSMAMMDELKLSAFKQVKISARISKSGDALPKDGDLYNELLNVSSSTQQPLTLVINKVKGAMVKTVSSNSNAAVAVKTAAVAAKVGIKIKVTLDSALQAKAKPDDVIFIYAKAMQGPPMPLAVVRKKVKDLPLTLTLDDSNAMMPAMSLSKFAKVRVGARISKSGNPIAGSGDLFNEIADVDNNRSNLLLININQQKP